MLALAVPTSATWIETVLADFDAFLRARNPEWGVRDLADVTALAHNNGLTLARLVAMPANNLVLAFARN